MDDVEKSVTGKEVPQNIAQEPNVDLSIQDLVTLKNVVEVSAQRGTFKANEMEAVGKIFNKLSSFINSHVANNEKGNAE